MAEVFVKKDESYLQLETWESMNNQLKVGFTTRLNHHQPFNLGLHVQDDDERVLSNRRQLAEKLNTPLNNWVFAEQIHETNIKVVAQSDAGKGATSIETALKGVDGLITKEPSIVCAAFFADCVPLYFYDPKTSYIGIAHAGWRGTVQGMAQKMVDTLERLGARREQIFVTIGPCISQNYYEVDDRVIEKIPPQFRKKVVISVSKNRYLLDLKQLNVEILLHSGIFRHNIDVTSFCTYSDDQLFFSYRREGAKAGRMLGYIGYI